jgi:hypothetical protein
MKKSIVTIVIFASIFLTGSVLITSCNTKKAEQEEQKSAEGEDHAIHEMDSTATAYACPMHPEETGKEGDKCSKCGMNLEAMKSADSTATHNH